MHNIFTLRDALKQRLHEKAMFDAKCDLVLERAAAQKKIIDNTLKANPGIGILMRDGRPMYYINLPNGKIMESRDPATLTGTLTVNGHKLNKDETEFLTRILR